VVDALNRFVLPKTKIHQLIISGGGAQNPLLLAQLQAALGNNVAGVRFSASQSARAAASRASNAIELIRSSNLGVPEDAKEAYAFALMAYETFHQRPSNVPSATGAHRPAILGKISYAPPG
jgi:anhydro-N-acetylmuramic acid kinase